MIGSGSSVTVNINSTSSSDSTATATGGTGNTTTTTSLLPIYIFTNGTFAVPLFTTGLTGFTNIGLGGLFGFGQLGGLFFGRAFSQSYFSLLDFILDYILSLLEYFQEADEEGDFVYFESVS